MKNREHNKHPRCRSGEVVAAVVKVAIVMVCLLILLSYCTKSKACGYDCGGHDSDVTHEHHNSRTLVAKVDVRQIVAGVIGAGISGYCLTRRILKWTGVTRTNCADDIFGKKEPSPVPPPAIPAGPVNDVTPANLADPKPFIQLEVRQ